MSEKGIIVLKAAGTMTAEERRQLSDYAQSVSERCGYNAVVADDSVTAHVHPPISDLVDAIRQQTAAIQQLADSNAALIHAMAEAEGMDDEGMEPPRYLDGSTLD